MQVPKRPVKSSHSQLPPNGEGMKKPWYVHPGEKTASSQMCGPSWQLHLEEGDVTLISHFEQHSTPNDGGEVWNRFELIGRGKGFLNSNNLGPVCYMAMGSDLTKG